MQKAVDSEGTEIDLLSSGTQYFALYKNVHFITKAVYPVSFVVTPDGLTNVVVKVNGQEVTGTVSLEAGTYPVEVTADNCKAYTGNITITADAATHTQTIAMTYLPADYTKVDEAIAKANALNTDEYKDFTAVEAAVNAVVRDKNITEQSEVDAMAKAIEDAIAALQYKDADYTKVDAAIAKANALKKDDYKDFSGVEAAVNAVVRDKNITEQSEVDAMAKAIEDAIAALQYKDADYTKVDAAIAKANALKKDDYKDFSGVEAAVNAVVRDKNITEQSEVDAMAKAIEDAIAALEKKPASTKPGTSDRNPQTGDTSNVALWMALLFVSGGAAIGATVVSKKKKSTTDNWIAFPYFGGIKMKKKILSLLLALCLVMALVPMTAFAAGTTDSWDGTADTSWYDENETVFHLQTAEQLAGMAKLINDDTAYFKDKTVYLDNDLDLGGHEWISIGDGANTDVGSFQGVFDGQSHVVYNLYSHEGLKSEKQRQ